MRTRTGILLVAGAVFTAGLLIGFGGYVFAGGPVPGLDITIEQIPGGRVSAKNYNSSLSNKSVGKVREEVGNILISYGFGGADINKITDALESKGVYETELRWWLVARGLNEKDAGDILLEFDKIGIGSDTAPSAPAAGGTIVIKDDSGGDTAQAAPEGTIKEILPSGIRSEISTPVAEDMPQSARGEVIKVNPPQGSGDPLKGLNICRAFPPGKCLSAVKVEEIRKDFQETQMNIIRNIRSAAPEERKSLIDELKAKREAFQTEIVSMNLSIRENAKGLRDNFRETVRIKWSRDNGSVVYPRIANAHGNGLRMLNRFRSAMARFDHILSRLESRVEKLEVRGVNVSSVIPLVEEAKNISVENAAKLEQLKAKYESLLLGENVKGVAEEARAIATELKIETENLHVKLREIAMAVGGFIKIQGIPGK